MSLARALTFGLVVCFASAAFAQDDDLPALPTGKKPPPVAKPKPKPAPTAAKPKPKPTKPAVEEDLPPLVAPTATVLVKLTAPVKGARLLIDDKDVGVLPQPAQTLTNGDHTVAIKRLGFSTWTKTVKVTGKPLEVAATLEATAGVLSVSSDVAGAEVFVNGRPAGTTPLSDLEVPVGNIEVAVKKEGYRDGTQTVAVKAGRDYPVEVKLGAPVVVAAAATASDKPLATELTPTASSNNDLAPTQSVEKSDAVYTKAWFWGVIAVGVAAIATGVSVGVYAATPPPKLSSSDVCGGMPCNACINCPTGGAH